MPTSLLSQYDVGDVLGVGTVGTIYEATDRETGDHVAIKKLHPGVSQDQLIRARFKREMMVLERLHHPHIVRYYGGGDDEGQLFYVMELVDGGTVKGLLEAQGPLRWPVVAEIGRQLSSALQFAHNHGVIHRDLKPGNLFLTRSANVKLGDFGIARDLESADISSSGMTVGTHAYMAPEQIQGDVSISGTADLYSLGCCMFEMLVGRTPYVGDNYVQLFEQHLRAEPPRVRNWVQDCPSELDDTIHQLLAKKPEDRPFNARQVQAVMLRLQETANPDRSDGDESDVGTVAARGKQLLQEQIRQRLKATPRTEVTWGKLGVMVAAIICVVVAASILSN